MTNKTSWVALLALGIAIATAGWVYHSQPAPLSGTAGGLLAENYLPFVMYNGGYNTAKSIATTGDLTVGSTGTALTNVQKGTCSLIRTSYSIVASTTIIADCAITGIVASDVVFGQFASSTVNTGGGSGWFITGASASSTNGFATFSLTNNTGATATIPASIASSTQYLILR